jgi:hypothetical protein
MQVMKGRFFGGRTLGCDFWDGVTNYVVKEAEEKEENRLGKPITLPPSPSLSTSTPHDA